jgi:SAM-dependent methyltransferase
MSPSPVESLLQAGVRPGSVVLDIGCGTGLQARELARTGFRVVATDSDGDALATGRELSELDAVRADSVLPSFLAVRAERLPLRGETFDAVLCFDVLHWSCDATVFNAVWDEAWRVLRPGGLFLVRCLMRDALPTAVPLGSGRFRLDSGAEWFLPDGALLDSVLARCGGKWLASPEAGAHGSATMLARKPA